ncbi:ABC transporter permease [Virgibacillus siamensis]|uniref:ABC transporter permease n=1 Tax=Virgibacillus siamensis TaxID=480071 RepID=UPI0015890735|nr:ABC transporter permease [Virgibacillus siamensis]
MTLTAIVRDYINNIKKYKYLMSILVRKDIKKKYKDSVLGVLWSFLNPLLIMIVLTIVFSNLFGTQISNFPVYLLTAKLLLDFFKSSTNQGMRSMRAYSGLIKKVPMPKYIFTAAKVNSNFVFFLISLTVLIFVMIVTTHGVTWNVLYAPIFLIFLYLFSFGAALILATVMVFFRDVEHLYAVAMTALGYASVVFYPEEIIPEKYMFLLWFNPVYYYIEGFRQVVYYGTPPDLSNIIMCIVLGIGATVVGMYVFQKNQDKFILHV